MPYISPRRLYLNADKTCIVEEGDPAAAYVLAGAGGVLSDADAERYGLTHLPPAPVEPPLPTRTTFYPWSEDEQFTRKYGRI